jgi:hypothetical protein
MSSYVWTLPPINSPEGDRTMKKAIIALVVVFLGFWMFTDPNGLADSAQSAGGQTWEWTQQLFGAAIDFFGALG